MNNYRLNIPAIVGSIIFIVLAVALFGYLFAKSQNNKPEETPPAVSEKTEDVQPTPKQRITAMHAYTEGLHTIAGELVTPTQCDRLDVETFFSDADSANVELRFSIINQSADTCEPSLTPQRFKTDFEAPEDAILRASLNGKEAILNLVEVPAGETLEEFELFIKG